MGMVNTLKRHYVGAALYQTYLISGISSRHYIAMTENCSDEQLKN